MGDQMGSSMVQQYFFLSHFLSLRLPLPVASVSGFISAMLATFTLCLHRAYDCVENFAKKYLHPWTPPSKIMEDPLEELLAEMSSIASRKWARQPGGESEVPKSMVTFMRKMGNGTQNNKFAKSLLDFAHTKADGEEKLLKVTRSCVPKNILPEGCEGDLYDIKVNGREADDAIYSNHHDIRQMIPRGTTVMNVKRGSSSSSDAELDIVIYANRKFTGDIGDEDETQPDSNNEWQKYFLKDQEEAQQVVCMKKVNGEAAHFSGRIIDGQFYIITGSKNVHLIIKEEKDIDKYEGERYTCAKVVARCVWETLQALEERHRRFFESFLHHTKCTAICELLQPENQHIVNLSHLKKPLLIVIGLTTAAGIEDLGSLIAIPPHHTLDFLSCLGFDVPTYTVIPVEAVQRYREEIRRGGHGYHEEGEVLYFLGKDEETIGLVKAKTIWYIMLRALREKVIYTARRRQGWSLEDRISSTHTRFLKIQEWLLFPNDYLDGWKKLSTSFMEWIEEEMETNHLKVEDIRPEYPVIWEKFLKETNQTDCVKL